MRDLPSGTVTLLFTDIEGSTTLLRKLGPEYADALLEHRRLLRSAFRGHGGIEVDTQGDAFFYAFSIASEAVAAAAEAQAELASGPIKVRMGIHTGEPTLTDEGYVGLDVHTAARVCAAGHGGQVLLTGETRKAVSAEVMDLGEHRLKDLPQAVWLFQLGERGFPPLRTLSNTNLPAPASSFLGREQELADAQALLEASRLLTVSGPGGAGKTRFAIELASRQLERFPNGVFWVPLASLRDPALVVETVAQTLGAGEEIASHIGDKRMLLLLDNFEQVAEAAPRLPELLSACPKLKILVTSRETLRIEGESEYPLPPLDESEGVALFCVRANLNPNETIAELCRRLDGLPLAIELAAARAKLFTVPQLLQRIGERLDLLKAGRDADPRQQTLRATIQWSHDLLIEPEKRQFARLAVFAGGCTFEVAEQVAHVDPDTLQSLIDKSMVRRTNDRFWMLETIREFAAERFGEASDEEEVRRRHAEHYTALAEESETGLIGPEAERWHRRMEDEKENLRAALTWSCGGGDPSIALRLSASLWRFWWRGGAAREGAVWYDAALALGAGQPEELRARATYGAASMAMARHDPETATPMLQECLSIFRRLGDELRVMWTLNDLGIASSQSGDTTGSRRFQEQSLAIARARGDDRAASSTLVNLAQAALEEDRVEDAEGLLDEAISLLKGVGDNEILGTAFESLALVDLRRADLKSAAAHLRKSIAMGRDAGDWRQLAHTLAVAAAVIAERGDAAGSARALAGCAAICENTGLVLETVEREFYERTRASVLASLGEADFDRAWAEGYGSDQSTVLERAGADLA
jgi:predicted ATPase